MLPARENVCSGHCLQVEERLWKYVPAMQLSELCEEKRDGRSSSFSERISFLDKDEGGVNSEERTGRDEAEVMNGDVCSEDTKLTHPAEARKEDDEVPGGHSAHCEYPLIGA